MVEFYINKHIISDEIEPIQIEPCPVDLFDGTRTHNRISGLRPEAIVPRRSYGTYYGEGHFRESTYHITETIPLKDLLKYIEICYKYNFNNVKYPLEINQKYC